jgi:hypothetical protein
MGQRTVRPPRRWATAVLGLLLVLGTLGVTPPAPAHAVDGQGFLDVTVQGPDGSPLGGASVIIYPAGVVNPDPIGNPDFRPAQLDGQPSGSNGVAHFVQPIPAGQSVIQVKIWVEKIGYVGEWYQAAATYTDANSISIADGETNTTPFVALAATLRIVNVYAYDGDSEVDLGGVTLGLYDASGDGTTPSLTRTTDSSGVAQFKIPLGSLPAGTYHLKGARAGYLPQWYLGEPPVGANDFEGAFDIDLSPEAFALSYNLAMTAGTPTPFTAAPVPKISGTVKKGKTLTAKPGAWAPTPSRFRYAWYRGSKAINGASAKKYTLTKADVGKRISVKVKASLVGYVTTTRTSAKTAAVKP